MRENDGYRLRRQREEERVTLGDFLTEAAFVDGFLVKADEGVTRSVVPSFNPFSVRVRVISSQRILKYTFVSGGKRCKCTGGGKPVEPLLQFLLRFTTTPPLTAPPLCF